MRGKHSCIVAEIYFTPKPTRAGAGPSDSDNLAQRNLAILHADNPGSPESHTVMHTFEVQPCPIETAAQFLSTLASFEMKSSRLLHADELWFDWHDLPRDSEVTLSFPVGGGLGSGHKRDEDDREERKEERKREKAGCYIAVAVAFGLLLFALGFWIGRH